MHQFRHVLWRMRQGDCDRQLAAARLMGRHAAARLRAVAVEQGWLDASGELPDEAAIAAVVNAPRRARSTVSSLEAHRQRLIAWAAAGVSGGGHARHPQARARLHGQLLGGTLAAGRYPPR